MTKHRHDNHTINSLNTHPIRHLLHDLREHILMNLLDNLNSEELPMLPKLILHTFDY